MKNELSVDPKKEKSRQSTRSIFFCFICRDNICDDFKFLNYISVYQPCQFGILACFLDSGPILAWTNVFAEKGYRRLSLQLFFITWRFWNYGIEAWHYSFKKKFEMKIRW